MIVTQRHPSVLNVVNSTLYVGIGTLQDTFLLCLMIPYKICQYVSLGRDCKPRGQRKDLLYLFAVVGFPSATFLGGGVQHSSHDFSVW